MERKFHVSNRKSISRVRSSRRRPGCIRLFVCPTTGGRLEISVSPRETVFGLKAALARKLRVSPSKISLIYKDKVLKDGCIQDHSIVDESLVTLLPNMESGLSVNRSDRSILQALENLTETQVNDFLSGRSPLMLAIRMGENMVFVQLQLSMLHPSSPGQSSTTPNSPPANMGQQQNQQQPPHRVSGSAACRSCPSKDQRSHQPTTQTGMTSKSVPTLAEATRCLSQRLNRLHELNCAGQRPSRNVPESGEPRTKANPATLSTQQTSSPLGACAAPSRNNQPTAFPLPPPTQGVRGTSGSNLSVPGADPLTPPPSPGAIIETMKNLGRGIYSGTFQGTLDPSLQDGQGRPRRSVSTILHILNDLLVAAPSSPQPQPHEPSTLSNTAAGLMQSPMMLLTPPSSPTLKSPPGNTQLPAPQLASPPKPSIQAKTSSHVSPKGQEQEESSDNALLRGKMQRLQMMLAQRKEQRRTRREKTAPYFCPASSFTSSPTPASAQSSAMDSVCNIHTVGHVGSCVSQALTGSQLGVVTTSGCQAPSTSSTVSTATSSTLAAAVGHSCSRVDGQQTAGCCDSGEPCAYCKPSREQDSLAV